MNYNKEMTPRSQITGIYDVIEACEQMRYDMQKLNSIETVKMDIPAYQRGYSWDKQNFADFVEMLESLVCESEKCDFIFMGQMIFHISDKNSIEIVDGQQRLTSFLILAKIIEEGLSKLDKTGKYNKSDLDLFKKFLYIDGNPRFQHQIINRKIINEFVYLRKPDDDAHIRIQNAYKEYENDEINVDEYRAKLKNIYNKTSTIKKASFDSVITGYDEIMEFCNDKILGDNTLNMCNFFSNIKNKVMTSVLVFDSFSTAYEAFMSINSKGKDLSTYDLIRSEFIGNINPRNNIEIEKDWSINIELPELSTTKLVEIFEIMLKVKYTEKFYELKNDISKASKKTFLYDMLSYFRKKGIVEIDELYTNYKDFVNKYNEMSIGKFSDILGTRSLKEFDLTVQKTLEMGYIPFQPLIFEVIYNQKLHTKEVIEKVLNIVRYVPFIYVTVCGKRPSHLKGSTDKYLERSDYNLDDIINECLGGNIKEIFSSSFCETSLNNTKVVKDILLLIEGNTDVDKYSNHVEHIFPQKSKKDEWDSSLSKEHIHLIGNQVIAPNDLNSSMNNKSFNKKMEKITEYCQNNDKGINNFYYLKEMHDSFVNGDVIYDLDNINNRSEIYRTELLKKFEEKGLFKKDK